jgi:OCT family organic cation transporter-like MFS transporter 4/5
MLNRWCSLYRYWWIIPESPRWLLTQNRIDDAEKVVQKMAKFNKVSIPNDYLRAVARSKQLNPNSAVTKNFEL